MVDDLGNLSQHSRDSDKVTGRFGCCCRIAWHVFLTVTSCLIVLVVIHISSPVFSAGGGVPSDLPATAKAAFEQVRREANSEGVALGGIRIQHSPLLERSFPDYCIVRVDFTWRLIGNAFMRPVSVYAIPLNGGPVHRIRSNSADAEQNIVRFLRDARYKVKSKEDVESLRRVLWKLQPKLIGTVGVEASDAQGREWKIGGHRSLTLKIDTDGFVTDIH